MKMTPPPGAPIELVIPPPGGKRIKKISVTDDGKLQIEYEDVPE